MRSWYMAEETADLLDETIRRLHFATEGAPKWLILEVIVRAGVEDLAALQAELERLASDG